MFNCGYSKCRQPIPDAAGCNIVEDNYSMWVLHPACYEKWLAEGEAKEREKLEQSQAIERQRIAAWNALSQPQEAQA